ncbi:MAG: hypothetical protein M1838_005538 [Thelocarpon superellum]|nr:MAG: hypothetical protein M1838_005538 [Thelocarpon superellum]
MDLTDEPHPSLLALCDELLLHIFAFLDVPELLNSSRTCHRLRHISLDPILHQHRLHHASQCLSHQLDRRRSLSSLLPPTSTIYLSRTHSAARALSRSLIAIRLNRSLSHRPSASSLVTSNILPSECCRHDAATGEVIYGGGVAPLLVGARRSVERERVKDRLRGSVGARKGREVAEKRGWISAAGSSGAREERERPNVRNMAARFARRARVATSEASGREAGSSRWGRAVAAAKEREKARALEAPTRAKVLGLRRFWESVGRASVV